MLCRLVLIVLILVSFLPANAIPQPKVRVSGWYWLNSAPRNEWSRDFADMKQMGFTDVLMCWGVDLAGIVTRKHDTLEAIAAAHKAGLGVYLIVWQPSANSLPRAPNFVQVTAEGKPLGTFDTFNPQWRTSIWKQYLQDVAQTYKSVPGFRGYAFDDSFGGHNLISYGAWEEKTFGSPLPKRPSDPRWDAWIEARERWWEDWAVDTVKFIRDVDPDPAHILYVEDSINSLTDPHKTELLGLDLGRAIRHFDAVGGYTEPTWTDLPDSSASVKKKTDEAIETIRKAAPGKQVIYTFWSANHAEEMKPGPAKHPTAKEIIEVCQEALRLGVKHLDMYGYRIGEYRVSTEQMRDQMPPEPAPYKITGQFPNKFMYDRPEIKEELGAYLRSLNQ